MNRHRKRGKRAMAEINVVPYIDVMLVLLVIFMITTPLLNQGVVVELPTAKAKALAAEEQTPIIVSVNSNGSYFLNIASDPESPLDAKQLQVRVAAEMTLARQKKQQRLVLVKGDQKVDYGSVVQAMVLLQQAGVDNVGLMTQPLPRNAG